MLERKPADSSVIIRFVGAADKHAAAEELSTLDSTVLRAMKTSLEQTKSVGVRFCFWR